MRQLLKKKKLQNPNRTKQTQFSIGLTPFPNRQNYSWHYKKFLNRPPVILSLKQVVFLNHFQNIKEAFPLQNPSFLYNKPVFQKPNPNIFSKLLSKIFLTMEEGFYHENPSIVASKIFPSNWYYKP